MPRKYIKTKEDAIWIKCAGVINDGVDGHMNRDFCSSCAPWWENIPICPTHKTKLPHSGWCRECRRFYNVGRVHDNP